MRSPIPHPIPLNSCSFSCMRCKWALRKLSRLHPKKPILCRMRRSIKPAKTENCWLLSMSVHCCEGLQSVWVLWAIARKIVLSGFHSTLPLELKKGQSAP